jgi:Resolvase, N terminal domain
MLQRTPAAILAILAAGSVIPPTVARYQIASKLAVTWRCATPVLKDGLWRIGKVRQVIADLEPNETLMSIYGYARVSTIDQDLSIQQTALKAAGCEVIRAETASGTRRDGRTELQALLDFLHAGDTLVVTRIDRLARSLKDLRDIVHELKAKGVALKATEQPIDTSTAAGKAFSTCSGFSPNSKPICAANASLRASPPPRHAASIRDANRQSMPPKSGDCTMTRSSDRLP